MKTIMAVLYIMLVAAQGFPQEANMRFQSQTARVFALYVPSSDYAVDWGPNKYGEVLNIKFPSVKSIKYDTYVVPNLNIQIEKVPTPFDINKELKSFMDSTKQSPLNAKSIDRQIDGVYLLNSIDTREAVASYVDRNRGEVSHTVLVLLSQFKGIAVRVIFDSTEDIFDSVLSTAVEIIHSIVID